MNSDGHTRTDLAGEALGLHFGLREALHVVQGVRRRHHVLHILQVRHLREERRSECGSKKAGGRKSEQAVVVMGAAMRAHVGAGCGGSRGKEGSHGW
jgi:hypothetical protein